MSESRDRWVTLGGVMKVRVEVVYYTIPLHHFMYM